MTDVVGLPLSLARQRLQEQGVAVTVAEARSKKGSGGEEERVIRQTLLPDGTALLTFARFVMLKDAGGS